METHILHQVSCTVLSPCLRVKAKSVMVGADATVYTVYVWLGIFYADIQIIFGTVCDQMGLDVVCVCGGGGEQFRVFIKMS